MFTPRSRSRLTTSIRLISERPIRSSQHHQERVAAAQVHQGPVPLGAAGVLARLAVVGEHDVAPGPLEAVDLVVDVLRLAASGLRGAHPGVTRRSRHGRCAQACSS